MVVIAGLVAALGLVIDDVVTDTHNVLRRLRQHRQEGSDKSVAAIVVEATLEVRGAMVYVALMALVAAVPILRPLMQ